MPQPLIPVMALLQKVKYLRGLRAVPWPDLQQMGHSFSTQEQLIDYQLRIGAQGMANEFAEHLMKHSKIRKDYEPHGLVLSMDAYCFEKNELVDLLTEAFHAGREFERDNAPMVFDRGH